MLLQADPDTEIEFQTKSEPDRERQSETEGERETSRRRKIVCIYHCGVLDRVAGCPKLSDPPWSLQGGSESFGTRAQAASGHG